ncbi:MAG: RDD family protein [Bacteroidales bacterium]|nr:RDD family protein [Bacteroidales bacterium]
MTEVTAALPTAGLLRRLMAMVYDSLLLLGVTFAYGVVIWVLRLISGADLTAPPGALAQVFTLLGLWLVLASYFVFCWMKRGQTLAMKTWRLKLETLEGGPPSAAQCWLRCLLAPVSAAPAGLGYIWCLVDRRRGCWHDRWSDTRVVVLPKGRKTGRQTSDASGTR